MSRGLRPIARAIAVAALMGAGLACAAAPPRPAVDAPARDAPATAQRGDADPAATRSGREIYQRFREGLADPACGPATSARWSEHFASAPRRLASRNDDTLPLFGYVVDALREANLPTEYALIPFIESGYKPEARSAAGPAGLWQMIALTARNHHVPIRDGYDGRLSPVDSTQAAVRYLKTLHGMFAGDWRLAVMAYNAGEYRVFGALKRSGQTARNARPDQLASLSDTTQSYVRKLHALSCLMERADDREEWLRALDRPVPRLEAVELPSNTTRLQDWATRTGRDAAQLQRLNPALANGRIQPAPGRPTRVLAPTGTAVSADVASAQPQVPDAPQALDTPEQRTPARSRSATGTTDPAGAPRRHTVAAGDNPWTIARRYGIRVAELLRHNDLPAGSILRPGQRLWIDGHSAKSP
ncbi:LysM peptidoglycan-binding domain-containing protein [Lysobacter psychrotolerans]|uniref:LysM peptidoglycan-binding domain-containing protein n=2 Tax=Montanilutibacter psychrotolerans TaxID=1327343 RepID=A0A3M8SUC4_9GAMM|nr:LysM peptidoglycan-binding domain-containing protein [Lysobacter psychrotolerans]